MKNKIITIMGVRGFIDESGTAQLNLEDVSRGLGFIQNKSGIAYVRWERVNGHLNEIGFPQLVGKEYIPENVFYRLSLRGDNDSAKAFQAKVADDILPSIRKHGAYLTPAKIEEVLSDPDTIIQLATQLKRERAERLELQAKITEQQPLVGFAEICMQSDDSIRVRDFAHSLTSHGIKIGQNTLYRKLREWGFTCKGSTEPTQKAVNQGLFEIVTGVKEKPSGEPFMWRTPYVTVKGQAYIADRLRKELQQ